MKEYSIKRASIINIIGKYSNLFILFVFSAILSRILSPKEFGTVAVVSVFTSFFSLLANMGIGPAIIHNKDLDEMDFNHIYSLTVRIGLILGVAFALFSVPLSWFYGDSKYIPIGCLLSISVFFSAINIVPNAVLLRQMKFRLVNIRTVTVSTAVSSISIILALNGASYYAIVFNSILTALLVFLWNYITTRPKFVLKLDKGRIKKIQEYSSYQFGFSFINYFSRNLDNILIGKTLGEVSLAYYNKSYHFMSYPLQYLTHAITPVLHPILARYQDDKRYIYDQYLKVIKVLSLLGVFVTVYFVIASDDIIFILYGGQWSKSAQSFKLLSLSIWVQMISSSSGAIFQSIGNTKLMFKTGIVSTSIVVVSILIGIIVADINAVALCVSLGYFLTFFVTFYYLVQIGFKVPLGEFLKKLAPDFIALLITFIGAWLTNLFVTEVSIVSAVIKLLGTSSAYLLALIITKQFEVFTSLLSIKKPKELSKR